MSFPQSNVSRNQALTVEQYALLRGIQLIVEVVCFGLVCVMYLRMPRMFIDLSNSAPRDAVWTLLFALAVTPTLALVAMVRLGKLHEQVLERVFLTVYR